MERALTAMPSLSSSPRMRSVPPVWVLARHGADQLADLGVQPRPPARVAGPPAPEETPALAMPAQHGLGLDQEQVAPPLAMEAAKEKPVELVRAAKAWTTPGSGEPPAAAG